MFELLLFLINLSYFNIKYFKATTFFLTEGLFIVAIDWWVYSLYFYKLVERKLCPKEIVLGQKKAVVGREEVVVGWQ